MKYKQWKIAERSGEVFLRLKGQGVPPLVAAVLCARGLDSLEEAQSFLSWHPNLLLDPLLLKDMDRAVARIEAALSKGEKISVFGDYDVDGITSTCLLTHYLRARGGAVCFYIPCRLEEGYGVSREAVDALHGEGVSLIVTVDCGITAVEEARYAKSLGIDMVITDHHTCKETLPEAVAVVNPHREDCPYPFKDLAGVGVALKLVLAMEGPEKAREVLEEYADLAAVGTVADVMKLLGENRTLVHMGLRQIQKNPRPGLLALMEESGTTPAALNSTTVGYCIAPRLNAAGRMGKAVLAAELILTLERDKAVKLAQELGDLNRERQAVELEIYTQCTALLDHQARHDCIVLGQEGWHQGVVGIVASRLSERYACPALMICLQDGKGKGSARSYGGFHLFRALEACADLLEGYGGHAMAAGFTILEEHIPAFRARMSALVREDTGGEEMVPTLEVDVEVSDIFDLSVEGVEGLSLLEPYGNGNPKPVFALSGLAITCVADVGGGRHLKMRVARDGRSLDVIFFSTTRLKAGVQVGDTIDLAFYPQINEYRASRTVQLQAVDLHPTSEREERETALYHRLHRGDALPSLEAAQITPRREDFVALWRHLARCGHLEADTPESLARSLVSGQGLSTTPVRALICLDVFRECGLLDWEHRGQRLRVQTKNPGGDKLDLEKTSLMRRLRHLANG